jgi:hypothetical protein
VGISRPAIAVIDAIKLRLLNPNGVAADKYNQVARQSVFADPDHSLLSFCRLPAKVEVCEHHVKRLS